MGDLPDLTEEQLAMLTPPARFQYERAKWAFGVLGKEAWRRLRKVGESWRRSGETQIGFGRLRAGLRSAQNDGGAELRNQDPSLRSG
jgi:hypothetical protein